MELKRKRVKGQETTLKKSWQLENYLKIVGSKKKSNLKKIGLKGT